MAGPRAHDDMMRGTPCRAPSVTPSPSTSPSRSPPSRWRPTTSGRSPSGRRRRSCSAAHTCSSRWCSPSCLFRRARPKDDLPVSDEQRHIDGRLPSPLDYVLLVVAVAPIAYLFVNYEYVVNRIYYIDDLSVLDMIMAVVMTVMVLEATRRVIGWALPITAIGVPDLRALHRPARAHAAPRPALHDHRGHLRHPAVGIGRLRADLRPVRLVHGAHRHRATVHGFRHEPDRTLRRRPRQGLGPVVEPVRHHFGLGGCQCHGRRADLDSA